MRKNIEYHLCLQIAEYLRNQYPKVIFHFDYAGLAHSKAQAGMMKAIQGQRGFPDLQICEARRGFKGLFLELKAESPFISLGTLKKQIVKKYKTIKGKRVLVEEHDHIQEQADTLRKLNNAGYNARFCWEFDHAKEIIDWYLFDIVY